MSYNSLCSQPDDDQNGKRDIERTHIATNWKELESKKVFVAVFKRLEELARIERERKKIRGVKKK